MEDQRSAIADRRFTTSLCNKRYKAAASSAIRRVHNDVENRRLLMADLSLIPQVWSSPPGSGGLASASESGGQNVLNSIVTTPALFFMLRPVGLALRGATPP